MTALLVTDFRHCTAIWRKQKYKARKQRCTCLPGSGASELFLRLRVASLSLVGATEVVVRFARVRSHLDGALESMNSVVRALQIEVDLSQRLVRLSIVRIDVDGTLELSPGGIRVVLLQLQGAKIEGGREIRRVELERAVEGTGCAVQVAQFDLSQPHVIRGEGELRIERQRRSKTLQGASEVLLTIVIERHEVVDRHQRGLGLLRFAQLAQRVLVPAVLAVAHGFSEQLVDLDTILGIGERLAAGLDERAG